MIPHGGCAVGYGCTPFFGVHSPVPATRCRQDLGLFERVEDPTAGQFIGHLSVQGLDAVVSQGVPSSMNSGFTMRNARPKRELQDAGELTWQR